MTVVLIALAGGLILFALVMFLALVPDIFGLDSPVCLDPGCGCTGLAGDPTHESAVRSEAEA